MNKNDITFQILDWNFTHEDSDDDIETYVIQLFGKTSNNKSIYVKVNNFKPFFYIGLDKISPLHYESVINNIKDNFKYNKEFVKGFYKYEIENKCKFRGFTNYQKFPFMKLIFNNLTTMREWNKFFWKKHLMPQISNEYYKFQVYESNIEPFLRYMHIRNIDAAGWCSIQKNKYIQLDTETYCDINIEIQHNNLNRFDNGDIQPFTIAAFDIECTSEDGSFPQATRKNDKIIQIGTVFLKFGEQDCYYQHIITLDTCDSIPNVDVVQCATEEDVLLEWSKLIQRTNPDVLTGYNTFGFDYKYMHDRAMLLGVEDDFSKLSKIRGATSKFIEKDLSSSALGKNLLYYYDMTGRINIDLMKVVQRDYKLGSYKLDYVASAFIKENILKMENNNKRLTSKIVTNSIYGVKENQYITVYYNDSLTDNKHMDGRKFKIIRFEKEIIKEKNKKTQIMEDVEKDVIIVNGIIDLEVMTKGYKVFWCQAKDDVSAKDIFRLQKGSSRDRAIVAKYCVMDCVLCIKLINKLCVIPNNVGMANVCSVPLSYLFMRGQTIKVFSLVAKKCRQENHLIPVLFRKKKPVTEDDKAKKARDKDEKRQIQKFIDSLNNKHNDDINEEIDDDDGGYEGATVFPPQKGIHWDPVPVLDYASLYPRSMICMNLSHETLVTNDSRYGKLANYKYNYITYMTSKVIEKITSREKVLSHALFKDRLKEIIKKHKKLKHIVESKKVNDDDIVTSIYDVDDKNNKRFLVVEISISKKSFKLYNYATSKFAQRLDGKKGIIPEVLQNLLDARSRTKDLMEMEKDPFKKMVLDGKQLAEKVTANSLYGGCGAPTSSIYMREIAASTTATGRRFLEFSRDFLEGDFNNMMNYALDNKEKYYELCKNIYRDVPNSKFNQPKRGFTTRTEFFDAFYNLVNKIMVGYHPNNKAIYGDTDSVFYKLQLTDDVTKKLLTDKKSLEISITIGIWSSIAINLVLPDGMQQEYEKVLYPFIILTKKRYVGNLYEKDPTKFYQKSMGIVLKRRDNAPIVKIVVGGIVDQILNKHSPSGAIEYAKATLRKIFCEKYPIDKFIITKTLKGKALTLIERKEEEKKPKEERTYANRLSIVHAVLADRMADRDPGNRPQSNDRIAYAYKITKGEVELQGDRVETPEYIQENNLRLDYLFYITNQVMKPANQFLEWIIEKPEKIFESYIVREENRRLGKKTIKYYVDNFADSNNNDAPDAIDFDDSDQFRDEIDCNKNIVKKKAKQKKNVVISDSVVKSNDNGVIMDVLF